MKSKELISHIASLGYSVYPDANMMPELEESRGPTLFVMGTAGGEAEHDIPIEYPSFQVIVKGKNHKADYTQMDSTESLAKQLINDLRTEKKIVLGNNLVYYIRANQSNPIPIGLDDQYRPTFSTNFSMKIQPIYEGSN
jgi:Bacteriophage minor capsid protein